MKNEILTIYLNVSPFGRNNQGKNIAGVEAARGIFGKTARSCVHRCFISLDCLKVLLCILRMLQMEHGNRMMT